MKANLRVGMVQGVNLTPQLLQSIRLLQLTAPQLEQELRQALERNPLLEQEEPGDEPEDATTPETAALEAAAWDELPEPAFLSGGSVGAADDDATLRIAEGESSDPRLRLLRLLDLHWAPADLEVAAWWLDHCDDRGYLEQPLDALLAAARDAFPARAGDVGVLRLRLLHGDWPGMAAADARECLSAQLRALPEDAARSLALRILADHVDLLAAHDEAAIAAATGADAALVRAALAMILGLRPHPVQAPVDGVHEHIVPDVVAWHAGGAWRVALNRRAAPRVRLAAHCERALAGSEHTVLRGLLDEARWLVRGVSMRNETLLRTAQALVERQHAFLDQGPEAILPLTLREVADSIGVHESTVSRIVNGKYIQTPRGTFELKRLFAVRLEGAGVSGTAVKAMVKRLIDDEPATAPLADDVIAGILARQGVRIARRTVAKYRDQLAIGPARARQRLAPRQARQETA
ncbi:RNA polymerase factor sigma-54 [Luteimonas kalidii]|uniref:RNA polymerase sigma-54 factor n=1 Tax=Luteimonas kalidii TaxID=3042025 RepID=A0ABT6JW83_9GAMM|nr:RNA polymerase factor sigma-54 [Luteimonas kalidii]MDH5834953.1 RNA polymerase factor sigma-54 [Luteimonas kalidii]